MRVIPMALEPRPRPPATRAKRRLSSTWRSGVSPLNCLRIVGAWRSLTWHLRMASSKRCLASATSWGLAMDFASEHPGVELLEILGDLAAGVLQDCVERAVRHPLGLVVGGVGLRREHKATVIRDAHRAR